jgi:hypothetical protein
MQLASKIPDHSIQLWAASIQRSTLFLNCWVYKQDRNEHVKLKELSSSELSMIQIRRWHRV